MRRPFLAGNWKMNKNISEAIELVDGLIKEVGSFSDRDILVCPPFTALSKISELVKGTNIKLGAQNCSYAESGAYTGEVSVDMLKDAGCDYVILGHSERRVLFGETDEVINKKAKLAISKGLKVVFCVGEVLEERENEKTFEVIKKQIINGLQDLDLNNIIIAYEPVWAIGTGKTASPEQAEEVHSFIRNLIATEFSSNCCSCCCSSKNFADDMIILYGGSVNPSTIQGLMDCKNVDGGLVGGASLKVKDFSEIVKLAK